MKLLFNRSVCVQSYTEGYELRNCWTKLESLEVTKQVGKSSGLCYSNLGHRSEIMAGDRLLETGLQLIMLGANEKLCTSFSKRGCFIK